MSDAGAVSAGRSRRMGRGKPRKNPARRPCRCCNGSPALRVARPDIDPRSGRHSNSPRRTGQILPDWASHLSPQPRAVLLALPPHPGRPLPSAPENPARLTAPAGASATSTVYIADLSTGAGCTFRIGTPHSTNSEELAGAGKLLSCCACHNSLSMRTSPRPRAEDYFSSCFSASSGSHTWSRA